MSARQQIHIDARMFGVVVGGHVLQSAAGRNCIACVLIKQLKELRSRLPVEHYTATTTYVKDFARALLSLPLRCDCASAFWGVAVVVVPWDKGHNAPCILGSGDLLRWFGWCGSWQYLQVTCVWFAATATARCRDGICTMLFAKIESRRLPRLDKPSAEQDAPVPVCVGMVRNAGRQRCAGLFAKRSIDINVLLQINVRV